MNSKIKIFIICLLSIVFCSLLTVWAWRGIYLSREPSSIQTINFLIKRGEGAKEISVNLKDQGLIKYKSLFRVYVLLKGKSKKLQAGQYLLSPAMNIPEIADKMATGDVSKEKITIVEGWNLRDIGWYLENKGMSMAEELFELVGFPLADYSKNTDFPSPKDFSQEFPFLGDKPKNLSLEGYLFPDTYEIASGTTLEEVVKKILANFDKKLDQELRKEIVNQKKSIFQIITIASLIEKEVRTPEDKKIVSGILWKRLKIGMPLQVDATIAYIIGKKTTQISIEETKIDSPYNTYKYKGLPLGPICNPGLESIIAALYSQQSQYLYYLSTPEGKTIFSKTLKEHNIAKAKYLLK